MELNESGEQKFLKIDNRSYASTLRAMSGSKQLDDGVHLSGSLSCDVLARPTNENDPGCNIIHPMDVRRPFYSVRSLAEWVSVSVFGTVLSRWS